MSVNEQTLKNIYFLGKYYNPASSHYPYQNSVVSCDRCHRTNILVAIGWESYDLCLSCADDMSKLFLKPKIDPTFFPEQPRTLMASSMFDPGKKAPAPPPPSSYSFSSKDNPKFTARIQKESKMFGEFEIDSMKQSQCTTNMEQMLFRN